MTYSRILGTGSYLPSKVLTNADLEKMVDTSDEWITSRTGIKRRHLATDDETCSSMAAIASQRAIASANIKPVDIDMIILATTTGDKHFPSSACILQRQLGITGCPAFDITAACAGFNYSLSIADQYIRNQQARHILVVGSEVVSRLVDWKDRSTCILFGDGAGAAILGASDAQGIIATHIHAAGEYTGLLYANNAFNPTPIGETPNQLRMQGNEVFKIAVNTLDAIVRETLQACNLEQAQIDWLIPHQANLRIIKAIARKLNLPMERVILTIEETGNTSAGSVIIALDTGIRDGRIKRGDIVLLESFGAGFVWGSALIRY